MICTCGRETAGTVLCSYRDGDGKQAGCATTLAYAVANIAVYYHHAHPDDHRQLGGGDPVKTWEGHIVGGTPTMPATQTRWDSWATVVAWCRVHMEELGPAPAGDVCEGSCLHAHCAAARRLAWPTSTVPSMAHYLARQHRWTINQHWAPDMLNELLDTEERLRRLVDIPAPRWYAGRCMVDLLVDDVVTYCQAELYATTERGTIHCPACGITHDVAERRDYLLAEANDQLVTASSAAAALAAWTDYDGSPAKLTKRISAWRDDDRLEVRDVTTLHGRDRHLYRLGDIQDLLVQHMQRKVNRSKVRA